MIRGASAIALALFVVRLLYRLQERFVKEQVRIALQNRDTSERNWKGAQNQKGGSNQTGSHKNGYQKGSQNQKGDPNQKGSQNQKGDPNGKGSQNQKGDPNQKGSQKQKVDPKQKGYHNQKGGQNHSSGKGPRTPAGRDRRQVYRVKPSPLVLRFEYNNVDHHFEVQEPGVYIKVQSEPVQYFCSKDWVSDVRELKSYKEYYDFVWRIPQKLQCVAVFAGIPPEPMRRLLTSWQVFNRKHQCDILENKEFLLLCGAFGTIGFTLKSFERSDISDSGRVLELECLGLSLVRLMIDMQSSRGQPTTDTC